LAAQGLNVPRTPRFFYGWTVVATLLIVNVGIYTTGNFAFGLYIIPMTADLGMSRGLVGWVQTGRLVAGGIASVFIGRLLDRYGSRVLIPIAGTVSGLAVIGLGLIDSTWQFFVLFAIIGLTGLTAPGNLLTSVPVAKWFVRRRGLAIAISATGLTLGGAISPPASQFFIDTWGWRTSWMISGVAAMVLIVPIALLFLRRQPEDMGLLPDGDTAPSSASGSEVRFAEEPVWTAKQALRTPALWRLSFAFMMLGFSMGGFLVNRAPYWTDQGIDPGLVSLSFTADSVTFGIMILLTGVLVQRFPVRYLSAAGLALQGLSLGGMLLWDSTFYLFFSSCVLGVSAGMNIVIQSYIWALYYGRASLGTIRGIVMPASLIGNGLGAPAIGFIYDQTGSYTLAWWLLLAMFFTAALVVLTALPPRHPDEQEAQKNEATIGQSAATESAG
jgi:sugar phosphate permease